MRPFHYTSIIFLISCALVAGAWWQFGLSLWYLLILAIIYVHLLVFGAIKISWNFFIKSHHANPSAGQQIALTFDDGPAQMTHEILDVLKKENVQAGFFTIGKNAAANPETVKRWDAEGHLIGNHSYNHGFNFDWQSAKTMAAELEQTNDIVHQLTGRKPKLFRPPYGVTNPNLAKAVKITGMKSIGWSIRSFDTTARNPQELLNRILGQLKGGDVILLHDSMPITHEILTTLIQTARQKGFTFVRPDILLGVTAYA